MNRHQNRLSAPSAHITKGACGRRLRRRALRLFGLRRGGRQPADDLGQRKSGRCRHNGDAEFIRSCIKSKTLALTYLPEIFHPGSSSSSFSPTPPGIPTTTSDLMVRSEQTGGAPGSEASGPMAMLKGVSSGAWQSYVSLPATSHVVRRRKASMTRRGDVSCDNSR